MRVVIETNVLVSRYLSPQGNPSAVFARWEGGAFEMAVSEVILAEYERALNYAKARRVHRLTPEQIQEIVERLRTLALVVDPQATLNVVEADPTDNRLLECAIAAAATYVITGDKHLLDLRTYAGIEMLRPTTFWAVLRATTTEER